MRRLLRTLFNANGNGHDASADPWVDRALGTLDPGARDSRFWSAFHRRTLMAVAPELARRRRQAELTVSDVVFGWSRALVPAALAAALGAFLLMQPDAVDPMPLRLEEALLQGAEFTAGELTDQLVGEISFAVEVY